MKNKKQVKMIILLMLISILVEVVISPLRAFDVRICSIVGFTAYFALVYYLSLKKGTILKPLSIFLAILSGCVLLQGIPRSFSFETSLISLPDAVMHVLGVLAGYAFYKASKGWRYVVAVVGLLLCAGIYSFHDLWVHKLDYGMFSGKVDIALTEQVQFLDPTGNVVRVADLKGTISILDFWYSGCGMCFREFPKVQETYEKFKENPKVNLYAVCAYMENKGETFSTGRELLTNEKYTFPCLSISMKDPLLREIGVDRYPTVIVLNTHGNVVYRGGMTGARNYAEKLLKIEQRGKE